MGIIIKEMCIAGRGTATSGSTITPGSLICRTASSTVIPATADGGFTPKMFAIETDEVDVNYQVNADVPYKMCHTGDQIDAFLANGESVAFGDPLCCAGNGVLRGVALPEEYVIGIALEAVTAVGDTRISIEII